MSPTYLRKYETIIVTKADAGYEAQSRLHERIQELMEREGAKPIRFEYWGKRKLAYPIQKCPKGIYLYHVYLANSDFVAKLQRMLQVSEIVLRYLTVKLADKVDPNKYDFAREAKFDTLPTEAEEQKERSPTTGWDAEVADKEFARLTGGGEEEEEEGLLEDEEYDEDEFSEEEEEEE